jgi:hypothetical protein
VRAALASRRQERYVFDMPVVDDGRRTLLIEVLRFVISVPIVEVDLYRSGIDRREDVKQADEDCITKK